MMKECTEFFGSIVRYCTIISGYDTDITYFDTAQKPRQVPIKQTISSVLESQAKM